MQPEETKVPIVDGWLVPWIPILRVAEIHRACAERIGLTTGHKARQVGLALNHLLRRKPIRPFFHMADALGACPGKALTAERRRLRQWILRGGTAERADKTNPDAN